MTVNRTAYAPPGNGIRFLSAEIGAKPFRGPK
jgi:hypothetical protein